MITMPSSVTGSAQTGFTTPGYTLTSDATDSSMKQSVVTALTGTQTGVDVHSTSRPFTLTFTRPKAFQTLGVVNPSTGLLRSNNANKYGCLVRKGVTVLSGQPSRIMPVRWTVEVPVGADANDIASVKAAISLSIGALSALSASLGDTTLNGVL